MGSNPIGGNLQDSRRPPMDTMVNFLLLFFVVVFFAL